MFPVVIVGVFFKKQIEAVFGSGLLIVGICLLATAALLALAHFAKPRQKEKISFWDALIVGLAQACAVLPGLSRSGATITTGLFLGNKKETIAKFSFLMVLIPVMGEALLDLLKGNFSEASIGIPTLSLVVGFIAAFVAGSFACKWMISIVKKGKLIYFSIYCVLVGLFALFV
jgi:undecaprenyl-diphosphatase